MTVTKRQAELIAELVRDCRPHGAPRWDVPGILANLAKIRDRSLAAVTIAAIQAAEDRKAVTPGVIPKPGPHWRTPTSATSAPVIPFDRGTTCGTCSEPEARCRAKWADDHEFESVAQLAQRRTARPTTERKTL